MTESTQLQTTENNNTGVAKMEPPPPISTSPSPSSHNNNNDQQQQQQQQHQHNHHHQHPFQQQQQHYALKWNDFQTSMLSSFRHLRDEEDFVDVTLACDQRSFTAHKVVLSACSPYFRKLLKANPCEHPIVILRDIRCEDVENLLSFMYNGEVNVSHEQLSDFLKTAHLLQVRGLADVNGATSKLSSITSTKLSSLGNNNINNINNNSSSATPSAVVAALTASSTPAVQELKASPSPVRQSKSTHHWDLSDDNRTSHLTPPPQKRIKSADLFRAQHGISPERLLIEREFPVTSSGVGVGLVNSNSNSGQHALTRERNRDRDHSRETSRDRDRDRDRSLELRDSLLSQALESGQQIGGNQKHPDLASLHAQSAGEESNSSDTEPSDRGDGQMDGTMDSMNGSLDNQRSHSFPSAFLGLQGIPGLLPGPSGIHGANDFDVQNKYGLVANVKKEVVDTYTSDEQNTKALSSSPSAADVHSNKILKTECNGVNNDIDEPLLNRPTSLPPAIRSPLRSSSPENSSNEYSNDSSSSAMSLTVKHSINNNTQSTDPTLFHSLVQQHHQQQHQQNQQHQQQQQQQQQQQHFMQRHHIDSKRNINQQHMDEMQSHQQQLTANLFMARTIALSRSRDFPDMLQSTTAAAAAAAAAAASTTAAGANSNYLLPCPLCETPLEQRVFRQHLDRHYPRDSPVCPVLECGRRFAHPNSVRNHMRIKHTLQWAKMKAMRSSGGPFSGIPDFK